MRSRLRKALPGGLGLLGLTVLLGGCNVPNFWGYKGSTTQGHDEFKMYVFTVIAGIIVGGFVALLILWAVVRYRRRNDEIPRQFQYHGPVEVLYTVIPIVIVLVIFAFTVASENNIDALAPNPAAQVKVTAFQWGWEFEYPSQKIVVLGHTTQDPDLVLPGGTDHRGHAREPGRDPRVLRPGVQLQPVRTAGGHEQVRPHSACEAGGLPRSVHTVVRPLPRSDVLPRDHPATGSVPGLASAQCGAELHRNVVAPGSLGDRDVVVVKGMNRR